ncbi:MAG: hypothetical protein WAL95_16070 [Candidatus Acidiferrales bacterium]
MAVMDLYSKRRKREASQGKTDVYQYAKIPSPLRIQIVHIWQAALGRWFPASNNYHAPRSRSSGVWNFIEKTIAKENGVWNLGIAANATDHRCIEYLLSADTDGALDIIELSFRSIDRIIRGFSTSDLDTSGVEQDADDAIEELNQRFREHGVGFQYVAGEIMRVDSQLLHAETVKPALALLNEAGFSGPSDEFIRAFDHHRKGESKDAIADALNALESTMKAICDARGWKYTSKDTAKPLLDILFNKGLIPAELASHCAGLRSALESGLPTLANRTSRHGQGSTPTEVPDHFVAYALHLVASNVVFLVACHKALK